MTHGRSDQSGKPVKTTRIDGRNISYDTRTGEFTVEYREDSMTYETEDREVNIPRYGSPVNLDGQEFSSWEALRGELE